MISVAIHSFGYIYWQDDNRRMKRFIDNVYKEFVRDEKTKMQWIILE